MLPANEEANLQFSASGASYTISDFGVGPMLSATLVIQLPAQPGQVTTQTPEITVYVDDAEYARVKEAAWGSVLEEPVRVPGRSVRCEVRVEPIDVGPGVLVGAAQPSSFALADGAKQPLALAYTYHAKVTGSLSLTATTSDGKHLAAAPLFELRNSQQQVVASGHLLVFVTKLIDKIPATAEGV